MVSCLIVWEGVGLDGCLPRQDVADVNRRLVAQISIDEGCLLLEDVVGRVRKLAVALLGDSGA